MATNPNKRQLFTYPQEKSQADIFFQKYSVSKFVHDKDDKRILRKKSERTCRFCGKRYPETTFKKKAHSISHFLGNKYLINDFECDECNDVFSKYETELDKYLIVYRTLYGTKGKKGVPKIKSTGGEKYIINRGGGAIRFASKDLQVADDGITYQVKNSYVPLFIYKAFVKMALSLLEDEDIIYYKNFIQTYLLNSANDHELSPLAKIGCYTVDRRYKVNEVKCLLFQSIRPMNYIFDSCSFLL